jgi:hypothetical protein
MTEPVLYKKGSMKDVKTPYGLILRRYWVSLAGVSLAWFIYDFITYVNRVARFISWRLTRSCSDTLSASIRPR